MKTNISNAHKFLKTLSRSVEEDTKICSHCSSNITDIVMTSSVDKTQGFLDLIKTTKNNNES